MTFDCKRLATFCLLAVLISTGCRSTPRIPSVPGFGWLRDEEDSAVLDRKDPTSTYPPPSASAVPATMPSDGSANVVLPAESQVAQASLPAYNTAAVAASAPATVRADSHMATPPGGYPTTGYPAVDTAPTSSTAAGALPAYAADLAGGNPGFSTAAQTQQGLYSAAGTRRPDTADPAAQPPNPGLPPQTDLGSSGMPPGGPPPGTQLADARASAFPLASPPAATPAAPAGYAESFPSDYGGYGGGADAGPFASPIGTENNGGSNFQPASYAAEPPSRSLGPTRSAEPSVYDSMKTAGPWRPGSTSQL